jgi:UDPglucose 6-dehydrogenase
MNVSVVGTGYVGLITAACFAEKGHKVVCIDVAREKVDLINSGKSPIYERGLEEIIQRNIGKNLVASTDLRKAVLDSDITFICVGTPSNEDGSLDIKFVEGASESIGKALKEKRGYHVVVVKSTVVPGTIDEKVAPILEKHSGKKEGKDFGIASNPEFLREGIAVEDFMKPDRIIIGSTDEQSEKVLDELYSEFNKPIYKSDIRTAEMIKYASNAFLATKISFINEIGNICKEKGIDTYKVAKGMALDHRISPHFLKAGLGWGGSCFPKDIKALIADSRHIGYEPKLLSSVLEVNKKQPDRLVKLAKKKAGGLKNKRVAVLGLAFKGDTDDVRDSQAFPVIEKLLSEGAIVVAYDPQAEENAKKILKDRISYCASAKGALSGAHIALILTDWPEFHEIDFSVMKENKVIDARRIVRRKDNVDYEGLCW